MYNTFAVICAMFLTGQNCLFGTLVAVCDLALEIHVHTRRVCGFSTHSIMHISLGCTCTVLNLPKSSKTRDWILMDLGLLTNLTGYTGSFWIWILPGIV